MSSAAVVICALRVNSVPAIGFHRQALKLCPANLTRARGYKTFFMLNSVEYEILNAHKYKNIKKKSAFFRVK